MPKFISTEASLYNGISQQSPELRLPSQVKDINNANLTLARGVEIRPPVEILLEESGEFSADSLVHPIKYTDDLSYLLVIAGDGSTATSKVYDTDGVAYPIIYQDAAAQTYLETPQSGGSFVPTQACQLASVLDYTFVCNKNVTPAMSSTSLPALVEEGYIWIKNGVQQVTRDIVVNGTNINHAKQSTNDSEVIVNYFVANMPAGFTATKISNAVLKIVKNDGAAFTLTASDSYSDTTMAASRSDGCKIDDLPPVAGTDAIMKIVPEENVDAAYFLQYNEDTKSWFEVSAPGEPAEIDNTTMPHAFIRKVDDGSGTVTGTPNQVYFNLERIDYNARESGSNDNNTLPSFIGKKITDSFFFKNRLGFIAEDNVILSATDDLFRFFPTTVKEVLDDDPIDVAISSTSNVELSHVAPFPESLILVGDTEQFTLGSGGKAFTPENVVLDPTTSYSAANDVPPVTVGSTLYFAAPQSSYAAIREYSVQPDTLVTDAADITAHVPRLVPNTLKQLISENNLEYIFCINDEENDTSGNEMYVYKFYWQGNEKVQSAWIRWTFWFNPLGGLTFDGSLYLLGTETTDTTTRTVLVKLNLSDKPPIVNDGLGKPYKSTRPNIDRISNNNNVAVDNGNTITLEVTLDQYNYVDISNTTVAVVDRIVGTKYMYKSRYTEGGKYYFILEKPSELQFTATAYDNLVLGSYTLGSDADLSAIADTFPITFPLTLY